MLMKPIKFVSTNQQQQLFHTELRQRVSDYFRTNHLSVKGNQTIVKQTIVMLSLYLVPFIVLVALPLPAVVAVLLVVVMGIGMAGIGMCVMHDAVHGAYSRKQWVNKLMAGSMYLLGSNIFIWKIQHNYLHHSYTNIANYDPDINSKGPIRLSEFSELKKIHRYQYIHAFFFYGLMTLSKLVNDFVQLRRYNKSGITRQFKVDSGIQYVGMILMKGLYLLVFIGIPLVYTSFSWWQVLLGFFIMHWIAGNILSIVFQMAHVVDGAEQLIAEKGIINEGWAFHELKSTSDFARDNQLLAYYIGGLNFQIEHHLFPQISHVHYRNIAPIVEQTAKEFGYTYNLKPNFSEALRSHIHRLKQLGQVEHLPLHSN